MPVLEGDLNRNPKIAIFTDYNLLTRNIASDLIAKGFEVLIVTNDIANWKNHESTSFSVTTPTPLWSSENRDVDYVLLFGFSREELENYYQSCILLSTQSNAKTLMVFPYSQPAKEHSFFKERIKNILEDKKIFAGIILMADLFEKSDASKLIINAFKTRVVEIDPNKNYFLIDREDAKSSILKFLFSLSAYGRVTALISLPVSSKTIFKAIVKHREDVRVEYTEREKLTNHHSDEKEIVEFDLDEKVAVIVEKYRSTFSVDNSNKTIPHINPNKAYKRSYKSNMISQNDSFNLENFNLNSDQITKDNEDYSRNKPSVKDSIKVGSFKMNLFNIISRSFNKRKRRLRFKKALIVFTAIFAFPFYVLLLSLFATKLGNSFLDRGYFSPALSIYNFSKDTSFVSKEVSSYFTYIPGLGYLYKEFLPVQNVIHKDADLRIRRAFLISNIYSNFIKILNLDMNNMSEFSDDTYFEIDNLYTSTGLLRSEIDSADNLSNKIMRYSVGELPSNKRLNELYKVKDLFKNLPVLLGQGRPVEYAIILVDNRINRPSGGVIEAFALLRFSNGNLLEIEYFDAGEADMMLNGTTESPFILSEYADIQDWYLRDSLMNVDFTRSSEQVKWFLEKELDRTVDGIMLIDLDFMQEMLKITGDIKVNGKVVTSADLLSNFSKGNTSPLEKDPHFRGLLEIVINRIKGMNDKTIFKFNNVLLSAIEKKQVVFALNDLEAQTIISDLGYGGTVREVDCSFDNCEDDFVGIFETVYGDVENINKQASVKISLEEGVIKREITLYLKNQEGLKDNQDYKSYFLVAVDEDAGFTKYKRITDDSEEEREPQIISDKGNRQAGFNVEVTPGEVVAYSISWESPYSLDFEQEGEYRFRILKQPGEIEYPVEIEVQNFEDLNIYNSVFSLTDEGKLYYNTQLSEDLEFIFNWE